MNSRSGITCLVLSLVFTGTSGNVDPEGAAELYREALELLDVDFSEDERRILAGERTGEMREETRTRIAEGLEALSRAAEAERAPWPFEYDLDELSSGDYVYQHMGAAREAAQIAAWHAREVGRDDPDAAIDVLRSALSFSRHVSDDGMLIHLLNTIDMEGTVYSAVEDLAGHWDDGHRDRLREVIRSEASNQTFAKALAREREVLLPKFREALFSIPEAGSLSDRVRISSIVIFPDETLIGLEHVDLGISFRLRPGETRHGIALVSFDGGADRAVIREGDEEAVVYLQSRRITPLNVDRFFRFMGIDSDGDLALQLVNDELADSSLGGLASLKESLSGDESNTEVALFLIDEIERGNVILEELLAEPFGELATDRDPEAEPVLPEGISAFAGNFVSRNLSMRRTERAWRGHREMVLAGLQYFDNPNAPIPADPFSPGGADPLSVTSGEDGIEVRSQYGRFYEQYGGRAHLEAFRISR